MQPGFVALKATGKPTRETRDGLKDPLADLKDAAEAEWEQALRGFLRAQLARVQAELAKRAPAERKSALSDAGDLLDSDFWDGEERELLAVLMPALVKGSQSAAGAMAESMELNYALGIDWTQPSGAAVEWARRYAGELVKGINGTTRDALAQSLAAWLETPGATMGDLVGQLQELYPFSDQRAQAIAVTEVTRVSAEGSAASCRAAEETGLLTWRKKWATNNDEIVCPRCVELDGQVVDGLDTPFPGDDEIVRPPAHVRCRCWTLETPVVTSD